VNEAVAERLSVDPQLLSGGFSVALAAIMESTGVELQLGEVVSSKIAADRIIEILDNGRRGALFGITPLLELERAPFGGRINWTTTRGSSQKYQNLFDDRFWNFQGANFLLAATVASVGSAVGHSKFRILRRSL
jgi:hypothetical protein